MRWFITLSAICICTCALRADPVCEVSALSGAYGYSAFGVISDYRGTTNFNASGRIVADGHGGLSVKDTISVSGQTSRGVSYPGRYTINSDCTGTIVLASFAVAVTYDFVMISSNELLLVSGDPGKNISGTVKKQTVSSIELL